MKLTASATVTDGDNDQVTTGLSADLGKPAGQDELHTRPSAASALGLGGAVD